MTNTSKGRAFRVGALVSVALVVFAIAVMAISKESQLFTPKVNYWTLFENTSGLTEASPVRLAGVQVGMVSDIRFDDDERQNRIRVEFAIARSARHRIREGTLAYLKSLTYLSQDKYIELAPGDPDGKELDPGQFIEPGVSVWHETIARGQSIAEDVKEITSALRDFLVAINTGGGVLQELVHNPEFGRHGMKNIEESLSSIRNVLARMEQGEGFAGLLLSDDEFARRQKDNLDDALNHLRSAMQRIDSEDGLVARLEDRDGEIRRMFADLAVSAASLREVADGIEKGHGLLGRLSRDDEFGESLTRKIDEIAGRAASILGKIDRGEGSVGGIINDPTVHEGLKDIVAGVRKSRMGKGFIRHYEKKGAEIREGEEDGAGAEDETEEPPPAP
ncbi:MAG TPA: MlaD family protein [Candidatus Polarisedimenticolia bacterium]|nr:MlaD family protein [Candidatus Polarisedimenticolia bacterium]